MGFQVSSFKHTRKRKKKSGTISHKSLSSKFSQEIVLSSSNQEGPSSEHGENVTNIDTSALLAHSSANASFKVVEEEVAKIETDVVNPLLSQDLGVAHQEDVSAVFPQNNLYVELGFSAIFHPIEDVEVDLKKQAQDVGITKYGVDVELQEDVSAKVDVPGAILDVGASVANKADSQHSDDEESNNGSVVSQTLHEWGKAAGPVQSSTKPTPSILEVLERKLDAQWKVRTSILNCFKKMKSVEIKVCQTQCIHLIETYLHSESILCIHPQEYLSMVGENREAIRWMQACVGAFSELSKIMQHGALLIWDCISVNWIRNALTMVVKTPSEKHSTWKASSSFAINLKKFQWILGFLATAMKSVWSANEVSVVNMENEAFSVTLLDSYDGLEAKDRDILTQNLLSYIKDPNSIRRKDDVLLAQFILLKLQGQGLMKDNLPSSTSLFLDIIPEKNKALGAGAFGHVYEGDWLGIKVAIKEAYDVKAFKVEEEFVDLQHPHIVSIFDHGVTSKRGFIVMELMEADLWTFIKSHPHEGPSLHDQDLDIIMQIAEAVKYLNTTGVLHRDLKSKNIMIKYCKCGDVNCVISKLGDFGVSKFKGLESRFTTKKVGTQGWMAPELMSTKSKASYTRAVDVYSFAIICSEVLSRKDPYEGIIKFKDHREQTLAGKRPSLPEDIHLLLSTYIQKCWATNPYDRPQEFNAICEFLQYFKEILLRGGQLDSILPEVKEKDAHMLFKHFGLSWCLKRDGGTRKLSHIPEDLYEYVINVAMEDKSWSSQLSEEEERNVNLEIANYLGNWTSIGRDYKAAIEILRYLATEGKCGEAIWRLGYCYELGLGVNQSFEEAAKLYREAVFDIDYGYALVDLGRCYILGQGVSQSIQKGSKCWDVAFECQPLLLDSIKEQLLMFQRNDSNQLTSSKVQRRKAARRLLSLTIVSSGRKILSQALDEENSLVLNDDQLWTKNLEIELQGNEEVEHGLQSLGNSNEDDDDDFDIGNERSIEELISLREIFKHLRVDERTMLSSVEKTPLKNEMVVKEDCFESLKLNIRPKSNRQFYIFFISLIFWFLISFFKPWSYVLSFLSSTNLFTIFSIISIFVTLKLVYNKVSKL